MVYQNQQLLVGQESKANNFTQRYNYKVRWLSGNAKEDG